MKQFIVILSILFSMMCYSQEGNNFIASDMLSSIKSGDKAALLMVYFGSTHDDTRALTIEPLNQKVQALYKGLEVRDAFTSRIVIRRLKERGIEKHNPVEALKKLKADGFTHVVIQAVNIIEGVEMEALRRDVMALSSGFKDIRVGNPLLYTPDDYLAVIKALIPSNYDRSKTNETAVVWVGHGTYTPATAQYAMLDYMLKAEGYENYHVATVEGYPTLDNVISKLIKNRIKKVTLLPFMFVAGDHAKNDIAVDIKEELEEKGFVVEVILEGLGQNEKIQQIFIDRIRFSLNHKMQDIVKKKMKYETTAF